MQERFRSLRAWSVARWQALTVPVRVSDPTMRPVVQLLASLELAMIAVLAILMAVRTPLGLASQEELLIRVGFTVLVVVMYALTRRGYQGAAIGLAVVVGSLLLFWLAWRTEGYAQLQLLNYLSMIVLFTCMFLTLRIVWVVFGLHLAGMLVFGAAAPGVSLRMVVDSPVSFNLTLTLIVALVVYHRNLLDATRQRSEREQRFLAEALANTAAAVNSTLRLDEVLDRILENLEHVVPHEASSIMLITGDTAKVVRSRGFIERGIYQVENYTVRVPEAENLQHMVETHAPMWVDDVRTLSGFAETIPNPTRSYLGVPIIVDHAVIGILNIDGFTPGMFGPEHATRVRAFADQAAVAISNAQLFEREQRRRQSAEILAQASATINATLELPQVLDRILKQIQTVVAYDSASVMALDEDELEIIACYGFGKPDEVIGQRFPVGPTIPALHVINERQPRTYSDVFEDFPSFHDHDLTNESSLIRSWMGVPLLVREQVIGLITLDRFKVQPFTRDEVALTSALANQAATAIENARLYEEVQRYAGELEQHVTARTADLEQEIVRREQTATALLISEERYRMVTEMVSDYIYSVIVHADGTMETGMMSGAVERITGYTAKEIQALHWNALVHPDDLPSIIERMWTQVSQGNTTTGEYRIITKSGEIRWLRDYQKPVWDNEVGRVTLVWGAVQDITELRQQMALLEAANEELRALGQMRDEFVSNVSHELRTPITSLKLRQHLLQYDPNRADVHLDVMQRETERLARTIEDLLQLSRMDQGRSPITLTPVDLNVLAQQYVADRTMLVEADGLRLRVENAPDAPLVQADEGLLGQALSILLTNALYYTPAGGQVTLRVLVDRDMKPPRVGIAVSDTGPGIPPEEQARLFERFFRGTAGRQSDKSGTGLGLAILKEIVDRHKGEVTVKSSGTPGEGATFTIWLPALGKASAE